MLVSSGELRRSVFMARLSPSAESLCYCSRDGTGTFILSMPFSYKQDSRLEGRRGWGIAGLLGLSLPVRNLCSTGNLVWRLLKPSTLSLLCLGQSFCVMEVSWVEEGSLGSLLPGKSFCNKAEKDRECWSQPLMGRKSGKRASPVQLAITTWNRVSVAQSWARWEVGNRS